MSKVFGSFSKVDGGLSIGHVCLSKFYGCFVRFVRTLLWLMGVCQRFKGPCLRFMGADRNSIDACLRFMGACFWFRRTCLQFVGACLWFMRALYGFRVLLKGLLGFF